MDYGSGELVIVDQTGTIRERKLSRGGGEGLSDSSSKDGSIQSDTSLDSEDSCVSVIFVPHPDGKFGMTGEPVPELISGIKLERLTLQIMHCKTNIYFFGSFKKEN